MWNQLPWILEIAEEPVREHRGWLVIGILVLLLGVYPSLVIDIIGPSVENLLGNYQTAVLEAAPTVQVATQH